MNKKSNQIKFECLLQDEVFVNEVRKNQYETNTYIDGLITQFPEQIQEIQAAIEFIKMNEHNNNKLKREEVQLLWGGVVKQAKKEKKNQLINSIFSESWKIAASIIAFIICYQVYDYHTDPLKALSNTVSTNENVCIILSDGSEHQLEDNQSKIAYENNSKEVIVTEKAKTGKKAIIEEKSFQKQFHQIIVPYGRRQELVLSDGTIVQLNSGSKFSYPTLFDGNKREVFLEGEGYFEVAKNVKKPFFVKTKYLNIKVLGTKFNVSSYLDTQKASAVLVEGRVEVAPQDNVFNKESFVLKPEDGYFYSTKSKKSNVSRVDVNDYIGWKDGWFKFKDLTLLSVVRKVRRYYNKPVVIEGELLAQTLVSGKLVLIDDIESVLNFLSKTSESRLYKNSKGEFILSSRLESND